MPRRPEIGNVQLYPDRPLRDGDKNGYVLKFYCPLRGKRIRKNCGTRNRRAARRILRECRTRLLNGDYIASGGAITIEHEQAAVRHAADAVLASESSPLKSWQACYDEYYHHRKSRSRKKSLANMASRIDIVSRILESRRGSRGLPPDGPLLEYFTLENLEYLQDRLRAGDECRYDSRSANTVNSVLKAVMAFGRYCVRHDWLDELPPLEPLPVDEVMKGRPITQEEFQQMLDAVPSVVGEQPAESWRWVLKILWESGFRVSDVMNFSWDDRRKIHPTWPSRNGEHPTICIPGSQKNRKVQQIPMLPGLQELLEQVPSSERHGWVANPLPIEYQLPAQSKWFRPCDKDLDKLVELHSNSAIARACGVSDTTVRKWLKRASIERRVDGRCVGGDIPEKVIAEIRGRADQALTYSAQRRVSRLTTERVGDVICNIGEASRIVVQETDDKTGQRLKYASAHDLRRGCAQRLINAGVSAETLKVVMRHKDFKTTERYYGATREAQSAGDELRRKIRRQAANENTNHPMDLTADELSKLRTIIESL